jgi:hypothetical protein
MYTRFCQREVAFEGKTNRKGSSKAIMKLRCELETFSTSTLYHAEDLLPKIFQMCSRSLDEN